MRRTTWGGQRCRSGAVVVTHRGKRPASASAAALGSHPASIALPLTQQPLVVALDVEYTHVVLRDGSRRSFAAWVCLVGRCGRVVLKAHCRPDEADWACVDAVVGGVRLERLAPGSAAPLLLHDAAAAVVEACRQQLAGGAAAGQGAATAGDDGGSRTPPRGSSVVLVGHGLAKDLAALGLPLPPPLGLQGQGQGQEQRGVDAASASFLELCVSYDTMAFRAFQGKGGAARSLKDLANRLLGRSIQVGWRL